MTKTTRLLNKDNELVGIKVEAKKGTFTIPVVDARRSPAQRQKAEDILRASRVQQGSKFIKTSYSLFGYRYN